MRHKLLKSKTVKFLDSIDPPTEEEKVRSQRIGVPVREMRRNDKLLTSANPIDRAPVLESVPADDLFSDVNNVVPFPTKEDEPDGAA